MKKNRASSRVKLEGDVVIGKHALEELLKHAPSLLLKIYTLSGNRADRSQALIERAEQLSIPIEAVSSTELERICGTSSHQSFVAIRNKRESQQLKPWLSDHEENSQLLVVALDSILDPHNIGAIFRAAECFGVDLILWSKNRSSGITPVVTAVSVGATELVPFCEVGNLKQALDQLKDAAFEIVVADAAETSEALSTFKKSARSVLVLGGEEAGVQDLIRREAHRHIRIPMRGKISSLNVSQACAVLLAKLGSQ